jgi:diguanylate cyclase (GGDEF)-like protein/PAS domain S-box-containing protein
MRKRTIFGKFIIYIVLVLGIVLSVSAYFYTEKQSKLNWQNDKTSKLDLDISNKEKQFYYSLLNFKTQLLKIKDSNNVILYKNNDYFKNLAVFDVENLSKKSDLYDINFTQTNSDQVNTLQIDSTQINNVLTQSLNYGHYFFTLDGVNLYVAFTDSDKNVSKIYFSKVQDIFKGIDNYHGYIIDVVNNQNQVIYSKFKYGENGDFEIKREYKNANATFKIVVYIKPTGIDGVGSYSLLFMSVILLMTFVIVGWLFKQNASLNILNKKISLQTEDLKLAYKMFRKITGNSFDIISVLNKDLKLEYANSAYAKILNYNPKKLEGISFVDLLPEMSKESFIKKIKSFNYDKGSLSFEFDMLHANKKDKVVVEAMVHSVVDEASNIENYIIHCKDITSKRDSLKALLNSKRRFKDFADSSADWLWEADEKLKFSFVSSGIKLSTGFEVDDLIGKKISSLFYKSTQVLDKLTNDRGPLKDVEIKVKTKTKQDMWLRISAIPVYSDKGAFIGYRGVGRNITHTKQEQEKVLELATKDSLTGLLNRSAFMQQLDSTLSLSKRNGMQGALLCVDLDMFKIVNESHGHDAGDKVLLEISSLLNSNLRNTDIIGRIGGDEFAVIMHDINPQEARKKIKSLINNLSRLKIYYNGEEIQVTSSIGVVSYPSDDQEASQLLTAAGLAMHKAKDMGRNRVYMTDDNFFEDSFSTTAKQKMKWLNILRHALDNDSFEMHFQPMIPAKKGDTVIFESLLRIKDENGNLGSPVYFIEAAENFGLAQTLDVRVLKRCIRHHKHLLKQNKTCMLSINISGMSLGDDVVLNALRDLVKKEKPDTSKIIIEVTETAAMRDEEKAKQFVTELHNLGFKFALDDFGSGYSSFYYLKNLAVDYIKIDGEFVRNIENSVEDRYFVKALADLAKGLNVKIIAEFVENQSHVNILKEMGIEYMQGYHISKPINDLDKAVKDFDNKYIDEI